MSQYQEKANKLKYGQKELMKNLLTETGFVKLFHNGNWVEITIQTDETTRETAYATGINKLKYKLYKNFEEMYKGINCEPISKVELNQLVADQLATIDNVIAEHIRYYSDILEPPIEQLVDLLRILDEVEKLCTLPSELGDVACLVTNAKKQVVEAVKAVYTEKGQSKPAYEVLRITSCLDFIKRVKYLRKLVDNG